MSKKPSSERIVTQEVVVSVPSPESERRMEIRRADWKRIKRELSKISSPTPWLSIAYSILFGISGTTGLSIIPLVSSQGLSPWVIPAYVCSFVSTLILGIVFLCLDKGAHARRKANLLSIKSDMESVERGLQKKATA